MKTNQFMIGHCSNAIVEDSTLSVRSFCEENSWAECEKNSQISFLCYTLASWFFHHFNKKPDLSREKVFFNKTHIYRCLSTSNPFSRIHLVIYCFVLFMRIIYLFCFYKYMFVLTDPSQLFMWNLACFSILCIILTSPFPGKRCSVLCSSSKIVILFPPCWGQLGETQRSKKV